MNIEIHMRKIIELVVFVFAFVFVKHHENTLQAKGVCTWILKS